MSRSNRQRRRDIGLRDLELIRSIAESGSLTAAARSLHVSQPAASQRLSAAQQRIGAELFLRRDGIMQATAVGKRLLQAARLIEQELDSTLLDIDRLQQHGRNSLRIATQCYTSYRWLPFVLRQMLSVEPDLAIDMAPEATEAPYQALAQGRIDVALVFNPVGGYEVREHALFEDEMFAVMHRDHPLASRHYLNPANFAQQTLVLYTGDRHAIIEQVLRPAGVSPGRLLQLRMTEAIVELVRAGHGIAVLSGWAFDDIDNKSGLRAVRITRAGYRRHWLAVTDANKNSEHVGSLIACLKRAGRLIHRRGWRRHMEKADSLG